MDINYEYYKVFYYVAKQKSITLAAEKLCISQPAVSQSIKQLENRLNSKLFIRTSKGVELTPESKMLYSYIAKGCEFFETGTNKFVEVLNLDCGEIRIGASDMTLKFFLIPFLEKFHIEYPNVVIKVSNAPTPTTIEHLLHGKIDFGVVSEPFDAVCDMNILQVKQIQDIFIAGEKYKHLKDQDLTYSDLENLPVICLEKNTSTRKNIDAVLSENNVALNPEFELATSDLIVTFAEKNLGIGCVVEDFAEEKLKSESVFKLSFEKQIPERNICIISSKKLPMSSAGQKMLSII